MSVIAPTRRAGRRGELLAWLRERAITTPGRLALVGLTLAISIAVFGAIAASAENSRSNAADTVRNQTEPLLGQAVTLYTRLSGANATATATFLHGGLEPPARRAQYLSDLHLASAALATLARKVGQSPQGQAAIATITDQLPIYTGLVESARANNRQGLPIGAAYLRQGSALLATTILPAADRLYAIEARRLSDGYGTGTGAAALAVLVVIAVLALAILLAAQLYLGRISRRNLNVPLVLATSLLAVVSIWAVIGLLSEQSSLSTARRGSDAVEVSSATSVLLSRAQSDQSLALVNRGSDQTDPLDFKAVKHVLGAPGGMIDEARTLAGPNGAGAARVRLSADFAAYRVLAARITAAEANGLTGRAITIQSSRRATAVTDRLSSDLGGETVAAQRRFASSAADATSALSGLSVAIPLLTVLAVVLALAGIRQRLQEYR